MNRLETAVLNNSVDPNHLEAFIQALDPELIVYFPEILEPSSWRGQIHSLWHLVRNIEMVSYAGTPEQYDDVLRLVIAAQISQFRECYMAPHIKQPVIMPGAEALLLKASQLCMEILRKNVSL